MLKDRDATATIAVKDIDRARRFYEDVVGLTPLPATNRATAATWMVDDELDDTVRTLKSKGVAFEHYDMPGITRQGDVHLTGKSKAAWFKDPDGNIIALVGR
jgi:catechol 2,3-dioxygenase-like lactoylglutathione lyase family enzyme